MSYVLRLRTLGKDCYKSDMGSNVKKRGAPCRERGGERRGGTQRGKGTRGRVGSNGTSVIYMVRRMAEFKKSKNPGHLRHT